MAAGYGLTIACRESRYPALRSASRSIWRNNRGCSGNYHYIFPLIHNKKNSCNPCNTLL